MKLIDFNEYDIQKRIDICQVNMQKEGFVGLVLSAESNFAYYSGYVTHAPWSTFTRPHFLFIPQKGKPCFLAQTFVAPEVESVSTGCDVVAFASLLGPSADDLVEVMDRLSMTRGKVGFELGYEQRIGFEIHTFEQLKKTLVHVEFADASGLIWKQRIIKAEKEIACIQRACDATSYAHDKTFEEIRKGMSEFEVSRIAQKHMLDGGAEYPGFVIITSGKGNYGRISKVHTNRKLEDGDLLWLDLGARHRGYWSDFCRAGVVGKVSDERAALQKKVHEITMEAAESIKPNTPVADVALACKRAMEKRGFDASFDCGRMGHGMGLMSTEPPSVTVYDDTILEEGMIINLEPGIVNDLGVFDLEENFVVTETGCKLLSGGSRELHTI